MTVYLKMAIIFGICFSIGCAGGPAPGFQPDSVSAGLDHLSGKRFEEAVQIFESIIDRGNGSAPVWHHLGLAYAGLEQNSKAIEAYKKALELNPELSDSWANMGFIFFKQGRFQEAYQAFGSLGDLEPENSEAPAMQGLATLKQGKTDIAEGLFRNALTLAPDNKKIRLQLVDILLTQGNVMDAKQLLDTAPYPLDKDIAHLLLQIAISSGDIDGARKYLEPFADVEIIPVDVAVSRAVIARMDKRNSAAKLDLEYAISKEPENGWALYQLGCIQHEEGELESAERNYSLALDVDSSIPGLHYDFGRLLVATHRKAEGIFHFDKILEEDPENIDALGQKGMALAENGEYAEALPFLRHFIEIAPPSYEDWIEQIKPWIKKGEAALNH